MSKVVYVLFVFGAMLGSLVYSESTGNQTVCAKGEVYEDCRRNACAESCEFKGNTCRICLTVCIEGCFCAGNTLRAPDDSCVPPEECPIPACSGPNEVFDECPPTCPRLQKCENLWFEKDCFEIDCCSPQCRCKPGFYRNDQNICVSEEECLANKPDSAGDSAQEKEIGPYIPA